MNDDKTKQQLVEKIVSSNNVLVTVSNNPSVDALSAAIALTVILNKLSKHTTAIFSGATPPAITFLDPGKTFEASTDSLRDFIIALDKEKADHLRYKVEGDMVKIFITPYRTTLSSDDLEFSQGDYNVELVLALGVENQSHLDSALEAHGSILHDATVVTISTGQDSSSLGSIDWRDETASSLSEMLVTLTELLKSETPLIDQQVATALLTGIVAETDRFSNTKTSSKVMTIAAQLMAAGADQQLIAAKLQESHEIGTGAPAHSSDSKSSSGGAKPVKEGLAISHGDTPVMNEDTSTVPDEVPSSETPAPEPESEPAESTTPPAIGKMADAYALDPESDTPAPAATPSIQPLMGGISSAPDVTPSVVEPPSATVPVSPPNDTPSSDSSTPPVITPPSEEPGARAYINNEPTYDTSVNGGAQPAASSSVDALVSPAPPAQGETRDESSRDDALAAVNATFDTSTTPQPQPFSPAPGITLPPPPPLPDFSALPTVVPSAPYAPANAAQQPERLGDILAPPTQPDSSDPGQFKIPGQ